MTSSLITTGSGLPQSPIKDQLVSVSGTRRALSPVYKSSCPRSCSANQLDTIVDILGVPPDLMSQRDLNRRLFLLNRKPKKSSPLTTTKKHTKLKQSPLKSTVQQVHTCVRKFPHHEGQKINIWNDFFHKIK